MTVPPSSEIIFELCLCLIANFVGVGVRGVADPCESYLEPVRHLRVRYCPPLWYLRLSELVSIDVVMSISVGRCTADEVGSSS